MPRPHPGLGFTPVHVHSPPPTWDHAHTWADWTFGPANTLMKFGEVALLFARAVGAKMPPVTAASAVAPVMTPAMRTFFFFFTVRIPSCRE